MTDRDALYRSILEHPADDTPRLVYADWLEENGRPEEAAFIRGDCWIESAARDDSDYTDQLDRLEEVRLWLGAHAPGPVMKFRAGIAIEHGPNWWKWSLRGFPRFFEFDGYRHAGASAMRSLVRALERAFTRLPTRWLVVRHVTVEQLAALLKQRVVAELDQLTVQLDTTDALQDDAARVIAECPSLKMLRGLSLGFLFGEPGAEALARCQQLRTLRWLALEPAGLSTAALRTLAETEWFRELGELRLKNGLTDLAFEHLCRLGPFPRLAALDLSDNDFPVAGWEAFARSKSFPALVDLTLERANLSDGRFPVLTTARWFEPAALDLTGCAIGDDGARALAGAPWAESLRRLGLRHNRIGPAGTARLANCRKLGRLQHLDLGNNRLGVQALDALAVNRALRGLRRLILRRQQPEDHGLRSSHFERFLARLGMPELRQLDLSGRPIGPRAARHLARATFNSLTRLDLSECKLDDAAARLLLTAPALQNLVELNLAGNRLSAGLAPLADPRTLPRLAAGVISGYRVPEPLRKKLDRRRGITSA
jgi:uncharacterized protein (TIGR02996 family)